MMLGVRRRRFTGSRPQVSGTRVKDDAVPDANSSSSIGRGALLWVILASRFVRSGTGPRTRSAGVASVATLLAAAANPSSVGTEAQSVSRFLDSLGVNIHVDQGYDPESYVEPLKFTGIRQVRDGRRNIPSDVLLHQKTGVLFTINGGGDLDGLLSAGRSLATAGALLALEGPNEPNNFPIAFDGAVGGGQNGSWLAVANFQRSLYDRVKSDPVLKSYSVFAPSETGAETDDVGLQFMTVPVEAVKTLTRAGTRFADFVNVHNYVSGGDKIYEENQAWNAADPALDGNWDGLYGNCGLTWFHHYAGYSVEQLRTVPKVTTETGWDTARNAGGQRGQGVVLVNTYLSQFKRGWSYTFIYEMRDGEGGGGSQGLYDGVTPKLSATYVHNLTNILADPTPVAHPGRLGYKIDDQPSTVHDLLLRKSSGAFDLVIWDERVQGTDHLIVRFARKAKRVDVYDVVAGVTPIGSYRDSTAVETTLTDHAVIFEITP